MPKLFTSATGRAAAEKRWGAGRPRKGETHRQRAIRKLVASLEKLDPEKLTPGQQMRLLKLLRDEERPGTGAAPAPAEEEADVPEDEDEEDRERMALRVLGEREGDADED